MKTKTIIILLVIIILLMHPILTLGAFLVIVENFGAVLGFLIKAAIIVGLIKLIYSLI